ncbi:terpene synthase family protein [Peterkaempfera bronchialis]|uniref:Terpene synthase n=1 Tax=Peterkaempfera bronchialis TaxID=2126346 RepID=A0A345SSN0_9ACTN|nr:terpene cyclase [Peterkaempfera bronchialis]AXI76735.1 terpene cyclase [Peterkaempfera bronchialis]
MELIISLPEFPFPSRISPHAHEAQDHLREWCRSTGIVADGPVGESFDAMLFGRFAARVYPDAEFDRLLTLADWTGWIFAFDDLLDDTPEGRDLGFVNHVIDCVEPVCHGLSTGGHPAPSAAVGRSRDALADLWKRITGPMPPAWTERFTRNVLDFLHSYRRQATVNASRNVLDDRDYSAHRSATVAMYTGADLIEYGSARPIPEHLISHPEVAALREAATNAIAWTNDLFSAPKEISVGDLCNFVTVLHRQLRIPLEDAAREVVARIDGEVERFSESAAGIASLCTRLPDGQSEALLGMVDGLRSWMVGHVAWSVESGRYRSRDIPEGPELLEATGRTPAGQGSGR